MRGNKQFTNITFTKRVDKDSGRHRPPRAKSEPAVCRECGAVYAKRRWTAANLSSGASKQKHWHPARVTVCPACKQKNSGEPLEAIEIMRSNHVGCMPVTEGDQLVGIVTSYDFLEASARLFQQHLAAPTKEPQSRCTCSGSVIMPSAQHVEIDKPSAAPANGDLHSLLREIRAVEYQQPEFTPRSWKDLVC